VISATAGLRINELVNDVVTLGPVIQSQLLHLSTLLTQKTQQLEDLKAAVAIEEENLQNVYAIEVSATALENLKEEYTAKQQQLEAEVHDLQAKYVSLQADLEKSYTERSRELEQTRQREAAEFKYNLDQTRLKDRTAYNQQLEDEKRNNVLKQLGLEAGWAERTKELDSRAKELEDYKVKVAGFDEMLRKAVSQAEAMMKNSVTRDLGHAHELEKRDLTGQISLLNLQKAQSDKDKEALAKTILELQTQLAAANKQVENIATKALESASGNLAMNKMQGVIEQTTSTNGGKRS
jgi:hypothetical protein